MKVKKCDWDVSGNPPSAPITQGTVLLGKRIKSIIDYSLEIDADPSKSNFNSRLSSGNGDQHR